MTTIEVSEETNNKVEELQEKLEWSPSKKDIVGKAIDDFHEKKLDGSMEGSR